MTRTPRLREAIEWIVDNDDVEVPHSMKTAPVQYLSGLLTVACVADIFGVKRTTVAARVWRATHRVSERGY